MCPWNNSKPFFYSPPALPPSRAILALGLIGCVISPYSCGPGRWKDVPYSTEKGVMAATSAPSSAQEPHCFAIQRVKAVFFLLEIPS